MEATEATSGAGIDAAVPERSRLRRLIEVTAFWCVWIGIGEALDLGPSTGEIETYLLIGVPLVVLFQMIKAIADSQAAPLAIALAVVATAGAAAAGYAYHSVHSSARGATGQGSRRLHPLAPAVHPHRCSCSRKSPSVAPWTRISTIPASAGRVDRGVHLGAVVPVACAALRLGRGGQPHRRDAPHGNRILDLLAQVRKPRRVGRRPRAQRFDPECALGDAVGRDPGRSVAHIRSVGATGAARGHPLLPAVS